MLAASCSKETEDRTRPSRKPDLCLPLMRKQHTLWERDGPWSVLCQALSLWCTKFLDACSIEDQRDSLDKGCETCTCTPKLGPHSRTTQPCARPGLQAHAVALQELAMAHNVVVCIDGSPLFSRGMANRGNTYTSTIHRNFMLSANALSGGESTWHHVGLLRQTVTFWY